MRKVFAARGEVYNKKGDHDSALADFNEAVRLDPANERNYSSANSFISTGDPKSLMILLGLGHAYNIDGNYQRAIDHFDEAVRLYPNLMTGSCVRAALPMA